MKPYTLTFSLSLLIVATPIWGQSPTPSANSEGRQPLNLSLPRDVVAKPDGIVSAESQDTMERNLQAVERQKEETRMERHPYGTGYEARQRDTASGAHSGFGSGSGAGARGGGRGGMGRGR